MRKASLSLVLLALSAGFISGQEKLAHPADSLPSNIKPGVPMPDKDGAYELGPGIVAPVLVKPSPAEPAAAVKACTPDLTVLAAEIGTDGSVSIGKTIHSRNTQCVALAVAAIKQSTFNPGMLDNHPVPVRTCIGIPFLSQIAPPVPVLQACPDQDDAATSGQVQECPTKFEDSLKSDGIAGEADRASMTPPRPRKQVEAEFSKEAKTVIRNGHMKNFEAISLISLIIDENGFPRDPCVMKAAGYGLDLQAVKAALKYRFVPATKNGKPVPARASVEVFFKLY
ncbi:MAG: energy transducer TonB [Acidobacteriota bacterium]